MSSARAAPEKPAAATAAAAAAAAANSRRVERDSPTYGVERNDVGVGCMSVCREPNTAPPRPPRTQKGPLAGPSVSPRRHARHGGGRRPGLPRGRPRSTLGAGGLNFRVRDGTGCAPAAKAARPRGAHEAQRGEAGRPPACERASRAGGALVSRGVAPAVPSALAGLTSGFGTGPGVPPPPKPPAREGRSQHGWPSSSGALGRPGGRTAQARKACVGRAGPARRPKVGAEGLGRLVRLG